MTVKMLPYKVAVYVGHRQWSFNPFRSKDRRRPQINVVQHSQHVKTSRSQLIWTNCVSLDRFKTPASMSDHCVNEQNLSVHTLYGCGLDAVAWGSWSGEYCVAPSETCCCPSVTPPVIDKHHEMTSPAHRALLIGCGRGVGPVSLGGGDSVSMEEWSECDCAAGRVGARPWADLRAPLPSGYGTGQEFPASWENRQTEVWCYLMECISSGQYDQTLIS